MVKRIEEVNTAGEETITLIVEPREKPDFLATLLSCGMPDKARKVVITIKPEAVVKRFGSQYDGYRVVYLGLPESDSDINTGISRLQGTLADGREINVVVWARAVFWRDAWAYFLNFYDASARGWRMLIVRQEMDKPTKRTEIGHKLVDGMKLAFAQFEGFKKATREDDVSISDFRVWVIEQARELARQGRRVTKSALARELYMNRDTVKKYLDRDPSLLSDAQTEWGKTPKSR